MYKAMLAARVTYREGSKKTARVEQEWHKLLGERADALDAHWTEDDGWIKGRHNLANVLRRYYHETYKPKRKGRR